MKYSNNGNVPLALALWLANDTYSGGNNMSAKRISVTSLLKPIKQLILSMHAPEMETDVLSFFASRNGTAVHDAVEATLKSGDFKRAALKLGYEQSDVDRMLVNPTPEELAAHTNPYPIYSEIRGDKDIMGWTVTGEFDLIINGQLEDIKNTKTYAYTKKTNDDKYIDQGSMYRWLFPQYVTKPDMAINFLFSDWTQVKAGIDPNYPPFPIAQRKFPLKSIQQTEIEIINKLTEIDSFLNVPLNDLEDLLPPCNDEELWRSESEFKYYSKPDAVRATKAGFTSFSEAMTYMHNEKNGIGVVKEIKGEVKACNWCKAFPVCKQKNNYIMSGELIPTRQA